MILDSLQKYLVHQMSTTNPESINPDFFSMKFDYTLFKMCYLKRNQARLQLFFSNGNS